MGADAFAGLNRWHAWQTIPEYAHIIVVTRPGSDTPSLHPDITALLQARETQDQQEIHRHSGGLIMRIDAPLLEISSSRIRAAISSRQNVSFLLPQDVITYIHAQSLYQAAG